MANYNPRLIKGQRSYTVEEIANVYGVDHKTCRRWLKEGLEPIRRNTKPLLIWGNDVRLFLVQKRNNKKVSLKGDEFFCMKCKKAVKAQATTVETKPTGKKIGREDREQLYSTGKCNVCGTKVTRFL